MVAKRKVFEAEIRDQQTHKTNTAGDDADVTVNTDELHAGGESDLFEDYQQVRIYAVNTQDQDIDFTAEHTEPTDTDYSNVVTGTTTTISSGGNIHTETLDAPVGRLRFELDASILASDPTSGHVRVVVSARK